MLSPTKILSVSGWHKRSSVSLIRNVVLIELVPRISEMDSMEKQMIRLWSYPFSL